MSPLKLFLACCFTCWNRWNANWIKRCRPQHRRRTRLVWVFFMWAARILLAWSIQPRKLRTCLLLREHAHSLAWTQPAVSFYYYLLVGSVLKKIGDLCNQINIASCPLLSLSKIKILFGSKYIVPLHASFSIAIVTFNIMLTLLL